MKVLCFFLGVWPDGITTIKVEQLSDRASLEIKSRIQPNTILLAEGAAAKHG